MKQRYRCAVIGTGVDDDEFRPKVADYAGASWQVRETFAPGAESVTVEVVADALTHQDIALDPDIATIQ